MDLSKVPEISKLIEKVEDVQEGQSLMCSCKQCYWNMWMPNHKRFSGEDSKLCVSESLADFKMTPNSTSCKGYWNYKDACGVKKGERLIK